MIFLLIVGGLLIGLYLYGSLQNDIYQRQIELQELNNLQQLPSEHDNNNQLPPIEPSLISELHADPLCPPIIKNTIDMYQTPSCINFLKLMGSLNHIVNQEPDLKINTNSSKSSDNSNYLQANQLDVAKDESVGQNSVDDRLICVICNANYRKISIHPCKHLVLCIECAKTDGLNKCPVCRDPIQGYQMNYM